MWHKGHTTQAIIFWLEVSPLYSADATVEHTWTSSNMPVGSRFVMLTFAFEREKTNERIWLLQVVSSSIIGPYIQNDLNELCEYNFLPYIPRISR